MGILDYFDKEKRATKKVETNIKKLTNPYRQSEERMQCAGDLANDGRPEAVYGLLRRFTIKASNQVVDEDEKSQVYAMVVDLDEAAVPSLCQFIRREDQLRYPLRALTEIVDEDDVLHHVGEALAAIGPDYVKNPEPKLHLIQHLAEQGHQGAGRYLMPFLDDQDETVRFQTAQALAAYDDDEVKDALWARLLTDEDESLRNRNAVCETLLALAPEHIVAEEAREAVRAALPGSWILDQQARLKRAEG